MFKLLGKKFYPIGIDLGSSSLKMVQLMDMEGGLGLVAASREDVPAYLQHHPAAMMEWYVKTIKEKLSEKPFKTRRAVTALPARQVLTQHLRMPKLSSEELRKALPWEAQGKVPFDINRALLRHIVAGEVYDNDSDENKLEVILMAASKQVVDQHLNLVERAKIELDQVNVEPCALVNCFNYLLESSQEQGATMFVDLGHACCKVLVTHGTGIVFCRTISIAAEHLKKVISEKLSVDEIQAEKLYLNLELAQTTKAPVQAEPSGVGVGVSEHSASLGHPDGQNDVQTATAIAVQGGDPVGSSTDISAIVEPTLQCLSDEIKSCQRYHDLMFENQQVKKVIFLGGMAKNKTICQKLAQGLRLPAQLGDPLARVLPQSRTGKHSDLEEGQSYTDWAVAFGLSLGENPS